MKKLLIACAIIFILNPVYAQRRAWKVDSLKIGINNVTGFFGYIINNKAQTSALDDSVITLAKLSTAVHNYINASGGGTITNNPDEITIKEISGSKLKVFNNALTEAPYDTLEINNATPTLDGYSHWITKNTSTTNISNFPTPPDGSRRKVAWLYIGDDHTTILDNANIDAGGENLHPIVGDIIMIIFNGAKYKALFTYFEGY